MKFIKLSNAAQDGSIYIDPDFIGMISRNRDADTFIRFKDGSYAHVLEMPNEVVEMITMPNCDNLSGVASPDPLYDPFASFSSNTDWVKRL